MGLEEVRQVQLGVLAEFDRLCHRHGLTYYLAYGTLLGAVRHGGYIPWDDDVDVMMLRGDYDRLVEVFASAAAPHLSLGSPRTRADWPFPYSKVGDERTEVWEPLDDPLPLAVNIDVFPLDAVPSSKVVRGAQGVVLQLLRWAVELRYLSDTRSRIWYPGAIVTFGKPLLRRVPVRTLVAAITHVAGGCFASGDRVGVRVGSSDWWVPASTLGIPIEVGFEGLRLRAPADPGAVLTAIYGDYRQLPPEDERVSEHAYTAVWRAND